MARYHGVKTRTEATSLRRKVCRNTGRLKQWLERDSSRSNSVKSWLLSPESEQAWNMATQYGDTVPHCAAESNDIEYIKAVLALQALNKELVAQSWTGCQQQHS